MNPQHISSLHLRNLITSKIIWEKHLKQQPPHTPSQCFLVFVRGTGLHVCKNDIIKVFTFENTITHSRTPAFLLPLLLLTHTWIHLLSPWRQCTSSTGGNKRYVNTCACRWKDTTQHLFRLDRSKFWLDRAVKTKNKNPNLQHQQVDSHPPPPPTMRRSWIQLDKIRPDHMIKSMTLTTNTAGLKGGMSFQICPSLISKSLTWKKYYNYWFADRRGNQQHTRLCGSQIQRHSYMVSVTHTHPTGDIRVHKTRLCD